ncbi:MAG: hypothetical protein D6814_05195, partial [Calditrichaeota bacterium]
MDANHADAADVAQPVSATTAADAFVQCHPCITEKLEEPKISYQMLFEIGRNLLAEFEIDRLLSAALDHLLEFTRAAKGTI